MLTAPLPEPLRRTRRSLEPDPPEIELGLATSEAPPLPHRDGLDRIASRILAVVAARLRRLWPRPGAVAPGLALDLPNIGPPEAHPEAAHSATSETLPLNADGALETHPRDTRPYRQRARRDSLESHMHLRADSPPLRDDTVEHGRRCFGVLRALNERCK
jgi:hypothetical protein